jgi:hypothetical protein
MMMKRILIPLILILGCTAQPDKELKQEDRWVIESIEKSGGDLYENSQITFRFREHMYEATHKNGVFEYVRITEHADTVIRDVLNNEGFYREINGERVNLQDTMAAKYARSVNSVIYFALLPDGLNDEAVNREYLGEKEIKGSRYHKIRITFDQQGGGEDYEDVFIYWFNESSGFFDYMAYTYHTDGGGIRFREAFNPRFINGMRFMDHNNYKPKDTLELVTIDDAFLNGDLEKLSVIELEEISVQPL